MAAAGPSRIVMDDLHLAILAKVCVTCLDIPVDKITKDGKALPRATAMAELESKNIDGESFITDHATSENLSKALEGFMEDPLRNGSKSAKVMKLLMMSQARAACDMGYTGISPADVASNSFGGGSTSIGSLPDISKRVKITSFTDPDNKNTCEPAFRDGSKALNIWEHVEKRLALKDGESENDLPAMSKQDQVKAERLEIEIRSCLSESLTKQLGKDISNNKCSDTAWGIMKYISDKYVDMGEAQVTLNENRLANYTWKKSGLDFKSRCDETKERAQEVAERKWPTEVALNATFGQRIMDNVDRKVPEIRSLLADAENLSAIDPNATPEALIPKLIQRMSREMQRLNKNGEPECEVFCVPIVTAGDMQAYHAKVTADLKGDAKQAKREAEEAKETLEALYGSYGKNNSKGKGKSGGKSGQQWCESCASFWKSKNRLHEGKDGKIYACYHDPRHCKWKTASQDGKNGNYVAKKNDKPKGGDK